MLETSIVYSAVPLQLRPECYHTKTMDCCSARFMFSDKDRTASSRAGSKENFAKMSKIC